MLDRETAMRIVRTVLAADFDEEGVHVFPTREITGRRRYPFREKSLAAITMGTGVVVCCNDDRLAWAKENLGGLTRDEVFAAPALARMRKLVAGDGQEMHDEQSAYLVTPESYRAQAPPEGIEISTVDEDDIDRLHEVKGFANALSYIPNPDCPDMAATVARHEGQVIGMAGGERRQRRDVADRDRCRRRLPCPGCRQSARQPAHGVGLRPGETPFLRRRNEQHCIAAAGGGARLLAGADGDPHARAAAVIRNGDG